MKTYTKTTGGLAIFVIMLSGAWAAAQTAKSADKRAVDPPASAFGKKVKTTGNLPSAQSNPYFQESQNQGEMPAHARRNSAADQNNSNSTGSMQNAQSNPLYEKKMEGTNPLYEGRDSAAKTKASSNGSTTTHDVVEYKDGEDATTRYRPGNNKTTKSVTPVGPPSGPTVVEYKDGEDGTTQTRPTKPK